MKAKKWLRENSKSIPMSKQKSKDYNSPKLQNINIDTYNKVI